MATTKHDLFVFQPVGTCVLQQSAHRPCVELQHSQAIANFTHPKKVRTKRDGWQRSALSRTPCMSPDFHNQLSQSSGSPSQHTRGFVAMVQVGLLIVSLVDQVPTWSQVQDQPCDEANLKKSTEDVSH